MLVCQALLWLLSIQVEFNQHGKSHCTFRGHADSTIKVTQEAWEGLGSIELDSSDLILSEHES
jgi:hypothetical protein